jgi:hypothetical protein
MPAAPYFFKKAHTTSDVASALEARLSRKSLSHNKNPAHPQDTPD